jgi:hypothetical protein
MRQELERIEVPDADAARARAWVVVRSAYDEREPVPPPRTHRAVVVAVALAAGAAVLAVATPPGRAVIDRVREAVGVEHAQPALFSLPASGRLLVTSHAGLWVVHADGSKRLLGRYREASWSPFGRFVVATRENELAALEPDGDVRWTLARRSVRFPRWAGSDLDTRIAYLAGRRLHVVAGDGTRDGDAGGLPDARLVPPAWQPGRGFVLTYVNRFRRVDGIAMGSGGIAWSRPEESVPLANIRSLEWSTDGRRLLVATSDRLLVFGPRHATPLTQRRVPGLVAAALQPGGRTIAAVVRRGKVSQVVVDGTVVFSCACELRGLTWSPDGRWLLLGSPEADQWIFVRPATKRIVAVSNVSEQFRSRTFPSVAGWCCAAG